MIPNSDTRTYLINMILNFNSEQRERILDTITDRTTLESFLIELRKMVNEAEEQNPLLVAAIIKEIYKTKTLGIIDDSINLNLDDRNN